MACVPLVTNVDWKPPQDVRLVKQSDAEKASRLLQKSDYQMYQLTLIHRKLQELMNHPTSTIDGSQPNGVLLIADGSCQNIRALLAEPQAPVLWLNKSPTILLPWHIGTETMPTKGQSHSDLALARYGRPGDLSESTEITTQTLIKHKQQLNEWNIRALHYGVAQLEHQSFVSLLSELSGSDVYSSHEFLGRWRNREAKWRWQTNKALSTKATNSSRSPGQLEASTNEFSSERWWSQQRFGYGCNSAQRWQHNSVKCFQTVLP